MNRKDTKSQTDFMNAFTQGPQVILTRLCINCEFYKARNESHTILDPFCNRFPIPFMFITSTHKLDPTKYWCGEYDQNKFKAFQALEEHESKIKNDTKDKPPT